MTSRHAWSGPASGPQRAQRPAPRPRETRPPPSEQEWGAPPEDPTPPARPAVRAAGPPPLEAQPAPQPLVLAELVRVALVLGAGAVWATPIPDPVLDLAAGAGATVVALAVSWGATQITKGKVWALRRGVDTDLILAEAMAAQRDRQR